MIPAGWYCKCGIYNGCMKKRLLFCRACGAPENRLSLPHCGVCGTLKYIVADCPEHGMRCAEHIESHSFCDKLVMIPCISSECP